MFVDNVWKWNIQVVEWLALPTLNHGVQGSNPAGDEIQPMIVYHFID